MAEHYRYLMRMFDEIHKGREPDISEFDSAVELALHEIFINSSHEKLGGLAHALTCIFLNKGNFGSYPEAFDEALRSLYCTYEEINKEYFGNKNEGIKEIIKFYKNSIDKYIQSN